MALEEKIMKARFSKVGENFFIVLLHSFLAEILENDWSNGRAFGSDHLDVAMVDGDTSCGYVGSGYYCSYGSYTQCEPGYYCTGDGYRHQCDPGNVFTRSKFSCIVL